MSAGAVGDMVELGITESFQVKRQMLLSASEAAEMILRVDNIIRAAPRSAAAHRPVRFNPPEQTDPLCVCRKRVPDHHPC